MNFERTNSLKGDWQRLSDRERELFRAVIKRYHGAAVRAATGDRRSWPTSLRVKAVTNAPGVWE